MTRAKQTCKILKELYIQTFENNDIEFVTLECLYNNGDCNGTIPKCEAKIHYLEQQRRVHRISRKDFASTAILAAIILMSGCSGTSTHQSNETLQGDSVELTESKNGVEDEVVVDWNESEVDEKPQFPGGDAAMRRFFDECYHKEKDVIIGSVTVGFIVDTNGKIRHTEIVEGDSLLGEQIIRILKQFPDYTPGKKNGKSVNVCMTFPFSTSIKIGG